MTSELNKVRLEAQRLDLQTERDLLTEKVSTLERLLQIALNRASSNEKNPDISCRVLTAADFYDHSEVRTLLGKDLSKDALALNDTFFKQLRTDCLSREKNINDKRANTSGDSKGSGKGGEKTQDQYDELLTMYEVAKEECEDLKAQLEVALAEAERSSPRKSSSSAKHF